MSAELSAPDRAGASAEALGVHRLPYEPPLAWDQLRNFLVGRGAAGVECADGERYLRTVALQGHRGWISAHALPQQHAIAVQISPGLAPVQVLLLRQLRRVFDLDAPAQRIDSQLGADPRLRAAVAAVPGLRVPGALNGFELALRAVLGQQVTVKAATTLFGRFATAFGEPADTPCPGLRFHSPQADKVAAASVQRLIDLGLTQRRAQTISDLSRAVASGALSLDAGAPIEATMQQLQAITGIGPWTAQYIAMRALRDPDAFPASDLGIMKALQLTRPRLVIEAAAGWRPWRAYAALHLWNSLKMGG